MIGCGSFGDMGCYSFAGIFKILGLTPPVVVEASSSERHAETYPAASVVHMDFPAVEGRGPVHLAWYDGGIMPARPAGLKAQDQALFRPRGEGILYVGDKGVLVAGFNGQNPSVYPEQAKYRTPPRRPPEERERDGAIDQWIAACKGGRTPAAAFAAQAPVTEAFLLGCIAQRLPGERIEWNAAAGTAKSKAVSALVDPPYRGKWR